MNPFKNIVFDRLTIGFLILLGGLLLLVLPPLGSLVLSAFTSEIPGEFSLRTFRRVLSDPDLPRAIGNTLFYAIFASGISIGFGVFFAIVTERTNTPLRRIFPILLIIPMAIPFFLAPFSWIFLLDPRIGLINIWFQNLFGFAEGPFSIYGMPGMILVTGFSFHFSYLLLASAFRNMDPSFEEAARVSGARMTTIFRKITIRMMLPAILSVLLIEFVRVMEFLDTPLVLGVQEGVFVLSTRIFFLMESPSAADPAGASALGVFYIIVAIFGVWGIRRAAGSAAKYATITGRGYKPAVLDLGIWKYVTSAVSLFLLFFINIFPIFILVWVSLLNFYQPPTFETLQLATLSNYYEAFTNREIIDSVFNTMTLAIIVPTTVMTFTAVISWFTIKTKIKGRGLLDAIGFLPIAIPGIVLGISMIWVFGRYVDIGIFGTIWIIMVAFWIKYTPYGIRWTSGTMVQINSELEEASRLSGGSWITTFRKITLPLLKTGMVTGWIYIAMSVVKELGVAILLAGPDSRVFSATLFDLWVNGFNGLIGAYGTAMTFALGILVILYIRVGGLAGR